MINPLSYDLCDKTVTVYRMENGEITRNVLENTFFQWSKTLKNEKYGDAYQVEALLIIPCGELCIQPGDRVLEGVGPEIASEQWDSFVPALVQGLYELKTVKPCYWQGTLCHVEGR